MRWKADEWKVDWTEGLSDGRRKADGVARGWGGRLMGWKAEQQKAEERRGDDKKPHLPLLAPQRTHAEVLGKFS